MPVIEDTPMTVKFRPPQTLFFYIKIGLKIPEKSESVNRKRTDNTMSKRNRTKVQTMIYTILKRKLKIEQHESTYSEARVTVKRNEHNLTWKSFWTSLYVNKYK